MNQAAICDITLEIQGLATALRHIFGSALAHRSWCQKRYRWSLVYQANYLLIRNCDVETAVGSAGHSVTITDQSYADEQGAVSDGCLRITRTVAG